MTSGSQTTETTRTTPLQLHHQSDGGEILALPNWAQACFHLGSMIVRWDDSRARIVVALALPTRAYAALTVSAGIVLERAKIQIIDTQANFQHLLKLPLGTALLYKLRGRPLRAVFDGTQVIHGETRIRVRVQKKSAGGGTHLLDASQSLAVEVVTDIDGEGALSHRFQRAKNSRDLFLKNLLSHVEVDEVLLYPRFDCLIIGTIIPLRNEMKLQLATSGRHGIQSGTLQDILKIRKFIGQGHTYRSEVMAVLAEDLPESSTPYATVFDGALSFLKWRDTWRQTNWIVVLDRTEPHFADAVNILNQEYVSDRLDTALPVLPQLPEGMDLLLFKEAQ